MRQLADTMPHMVWITLPDGRPEYFNQRWYEFTGFTPDSEGNWQSILHPDDLGPCLASWQNSLQSTEPHIFEQRLWDRSRHCYRWHVARGVPVRITESKN